MRNRHPTIEWYCSAANPNDSWHSNPTRRSRMRGGGLIVGEQLTEIHQAGYTSGGGAELDD